MDKEIMKEPEYKFTMVYLDRLEVYKKIYRCPGDDLIPIGEWRKKPDGDEAPLCHSIIRRSDLEEWLTKIVINGTACQSFTTLGEKALLKPYQKYLNAIKSGKHSHFYRRKLFAKSITALCIDLDVGHEAPCYPDQAERSFLFAIDKKICREEVPYPAFICFSGRGLYLIFLLHDESSGLAPLANRANQELFTKCYELLADRLREFKPDMGLESNIVSWFKAPDTTDHKTGNAVYYHVIYPLHNGVSDDVKSYSLQELAGLLGYKEEPLTERSKPANLPLKAAHPARAPIKQRRTSKPGRGSEPFKARVDEIKMICALRNNHEGHRERIIYHYFNNLMRYLVMASGMEWYDCKTEADERTKRLNGEFKPSPLSRSAMKNACKQRYSQYVRNSIIARDIDVKKDEVEALGLKAIVPLEISEKRKTEASKQKDQNEERRVKVDEAILNGHSNEEIMGMYGVSRDYLFKRRKKLNVDLSGISKS